MFLFHWLIFGVPWQIQVFGLAVLVGLLALAAGHLFGWGVVKKAAIPVLAVFGAIGLLSRAQQKGYGARKDEEDKAEEWAENVVVEKRQEAQGLPDDHLDERVDKWSRH